MTRLDNLFLIMEGKVDHRIKLRLQGDLKNINLDELRSLFRVEELEINNDLLSFIPRGDRQVSEIDIVDYLARNRVVAKPVLNNVEESKLDEAVNLNQYLFQSIELSEYKFDNKDLRQIMDYLNVRTVNDISEIFAFKNKINRKFDVDIEFGFVSMNKVKKSDFILDYGKIKLGADDYANAVKYTVGLVSSVFVNKTLVR